MKQLMVFLLGIIFFGFSIKRNDDNDVESGATNSKTILSIDSGYLNIADSFFYLYEHTSPRAALNFGFQTNRYLDGQPEKKEVIMANLEKLLPKLGPYYGYDLITQKRVGTTYVLRSYIMKYERQPLRITLIFYKPNNKWVVEHMEYDDELTKELK